MAGSMSLLTAFRPRHLMLISVLLNLSLVFVTTASYSTTNDDAVISTRSVGLLSYSVCMLVCLFVCLKMSGFSNSIDFVMSVKENSPHT